MAAGEGSNKVLLVRATRQGERGQLQPGDPSLSALRVHGLLLSIDPAASPRSGIAPFHPPRSADRQRASRAVFLAPAGEPKAVGGPSGCQWRCASSLEGAPGERYRAVDGRSADQVIVIKDHHTLSVAGNDCIDYSRENLLQIQFRGGAQALGDARQLGCRAEGLRQAGNKVGTEGDRGVIAQSSAYQATATPFCRKVWDHSANSVVLP